MKRLQTTIPSVAGVISVPLMLWDIYNQQVITSMGMAWDIGPPVWPYETPAILLYSLNFPAHFLSQPIANALNLIVPSHYLLVFPATLVWWWFVGFRLETGLVSTKYSRKWLVFVILIVLAGSLWGAATYSLVSAFQWWFQYGALWGAQTMRMIGFAAPGSWGILLGALTAIAAKRLVAAR